MAYINNKYLNIDDILGFNKNAFDSTDAVNNQIMAEGQNLEKQKQDVDSSIKKIDQFSDSKFNDAYADKELDINEAVGIRDYNEANQYSGPEAGNINLKVNEKPISLAQILGQGSAGQKTVNKDLFGTSEGNSRFDALIQSKNDKFQQNRNQALQSSNKLMSDAGQATKSLQESATKNISAADKFRQDSQKFYNEQKVSVLKNTETWSRMNGSAPLKSALTSTNYDQMVKELTGQFAKQDQNENSNALKEMLKSKDGKITQQIISYIDGQYGQGTAARYGIKAGDTSYFGADQFVGLNDNAYDNSLEPLLNKNQIQSINSLDYILGNGQNLNVDKAGTYVPQTEFLDADKFLGENAYRKDLNENSLPMDTSKLFEGIKVWADNKDGTVKPKEGSAPLYDLYRAATGKGIDRKYKFTDKVNINTLELRNMYDLAVQNGDKKSADYLKKVLAPHLAVAQRYGKGEL